MRTRTYDVASLIARVGVGLVFTAHGWEKIRDGVDETTRSYQGMRIPFPGVVAVYSTFVELLGGLMLILGIGLPIVGVLLFIDMLASLLLVHAQDGLALSSDEPGVALALVLALVSLLFACGGGGRATVDRLLFPRRTAHGRTDAARHARTGAPAPSRPDPEPATRPTEGPSEEWVSQLADDAPSPSGTPASATSEPSPESSSGGARTSAQAASGGSSAARPSGDVRVAGASSGSGKSSASRTGRASGKSGTGRGKAKGKQARE